MQMTFSCILNYNCKQRWWQRFQNEDCRTWGGLWEGRCQFSRHEMVVYVLLCSTAILFNSFEIHRATCSVPVFLGHGVHDTYTVRVKLHSTRPPVAIALTLRKS